MNEVRITTTGLDDLLRWVTQFSDDDSYFRVVKRLNDVHESHFDHTQALTHILSGSLKASGKTSYEWNPHTAHYHGTIEYGGELVRAPIPAPGLRPSQAVVNDPVDYAIFEMARGGEHDFFRDLALYEPQYVDAVHDWIGELGA